MLDALRKSVGSWVAKVFIGLLVLSFAVWGIADIFSGYRGTEVARVGETEIPVEVYRNELQREIQQVSQRVGTYLTLEQARSFGLDGRVLGRLIAEASLDEEARRRGLGMSDAVVADSIRQDPSFQAPGGQFDRPYFEQFLRATGMSEATFVEQQRRRVLRQVVADAVGGGAPSPNVIAEAVHRYTNEERSAEYVRLTAAALDEAPEPTEEELRSYFDENSDQFRAPELRRVAFIELDPETLSEDIEVTEADARAWFESRSGQFTRAERRTIEQIPFPSIEAAQDARAAIEGGATFEEIAEEQGVSEEDRTLGTLARDDVVDAQIAEAAFALEEGAVSEPVEGMFASVLLRVTSIEAGDEQSFESAADEARRQVALDRAGGEIFDLYNMVEDDRAGGLTLAEIAERRSLPYRTIDSLDQQGRDADGVPVADLPAPNELIQQVFGIEVGDEADAIQIGSEGYLFVELLDVTPARERTFEEARDDVREAWLADFDAPPARRAGARGGRPCPRVEHRRRRRGNGTQCPDRAVADA